MSNEVTPKEKTFDFPMMPIFGVDLGRELGSLDSRMARVETDIQKLDAKIEKLDAKIDVIEAKLSAKIEAVDSRVDGCLVAINRLDERTKSLSLVTWGGIIVILAAIIAQKLL